MTRIHHVTSPAAACRLIADRAFSPAYSSPLSLDSGLNCFSTGQYNRSQSFSGNGAIVDFEWLGPQLRLPPDTRPPLPMGQLIDQSPWRMHIRGPVGPNDLRVVGVRFSKTALDEHLEPSRWRELLPARLADALHRRDRVRFLRKLRAMYQNRNCYVQII